MTPLFFTANLTRALEWKRSALKGGVGPTFRDDKQ
jgi:hypothetical protein